MALRRALVRLTVLTALSLGGCYSAHGARGRDASGDSDAGREVDAAIELDAHVPADAGHEQCAFVEGALLFEVEPLTDGFSSASRGIDALGRVYLEMDDRAMRRDPAGGIVSLDEVAGLAPGSIARIGNVAPDGAFAGALVDGARARAFVWTPSTGMIDLSLDDESDSMAIAIGGDGMVLVNEARRASLRTTSRDVLPLGLPPDPDPRRAVVDALDVAANGTVVGTSTADTSLDVWRAFAWRGDAGLELLPNDGALASRALAVSDDGAIIVGTASALTRREMTPVRWRERVLERIPLLDRPELAWGAAQDVTIDGVIVGSDTGPSATGPTAYAWMLVGDVKIALDALLADGGWHVTRAVRVTRDLHVLAVAAREGSEVREAVLLRPRCDVAR